MEPSDVTVTKEDLMKKATHDGHCQVCGRLQRLPSGHVAKHGYTVQGRGYGGFFSGTCDGSDHLPYELSCELVKKSIEKANAFIKDSKREIAKLLKPATEPDTWVHVTTYCYGRRVSIPVKARVERGEYDGLYIVYEYEGKTHRQWTVQRGYRGNTPLEVVDEINKSRARSIELNIANLRLYVEEQEQRVKDWTLRELLPR